MKKLVFGALLAGLVAACGGGSSGHPDGHIIIGDGDGGIDATIGICNLITQTGCNAGEKCTWVRVAASDTQQLGQLGCVPEGDVTVDAACAYGAAGTATGYDDCIKGYICLASPRGDMAQGTCRQICDLSAV